jgi:hypothetical protein
MVVPEMRSPSEIQDKISYRSPYATPRPIMQVTEFIVLVDKLHEEKGIIMTLNN